MRVWDLYSFIWDLQESIGDDCKVQISIPQDCILRVQVDWTKDGLQYRNEMSAKFVEYMNLDTLVKLLSEKINRAYRIATVGED